MQMRKQGGKGSMEAQTGLPGLQETTARMRVERASEIYKWLDEWDRYFKLARPPHSRHSWPLQIGIGMGIELLTALAESETECERLKNKLARIEGELARAKAERQLAIEIGHEWKKIAQLPRHKGPDS